MKTKKTQLYANLNSFVGQIQPSVDFLPNISRDFFNEAKPKHIKNFILEMPITSIRSAVASANQDQLDKVVKAIYQDQALVKKIEKALS